MSLRSARRSEKTSDAQSAEEGRELGDRREGLYAAARLPPGRYGAEDVSLRLDAAGRSRPAGAAEAVGERTPAVWLPAAAHPAEARRRDGQPQEAVPSLSRGTPDCTAAWRTQTGARNTGADGVASGAEPALEPRLRLGCAGGRSTLPRAGRGRRLHARMPDACRRHVALRRTGRACVGRHHRSARAPCDDRQRQRDRAYLARSPAMAGGRRRRMALHRAGQTGAERLRGEPERPLPRRMPERAHVPRLARSPSDHRRMAAGLQRPSPHTSLGGLTLAEFAARSRKDHNQNGVWL